MESKPRSREEKIEFLKKLASGQAQIEDILSKVNFYVFEKELGLYTVFVYGWDYMGHFGPFIRKAPLEALMKVIRIEGKRKLGFTGNEMFVYHGIMPYEECERLRQFAEKEF